MLPVRPALGVVLLLASAAIAQLPNGPPGSSGGPMTTADPPRPQAPAANNGPEGKFGKDAVVVVTDQTWKATVNPPAGWAKPEFDDAKWAAVGVINGPTDFGAHYALDNQFGLPSTAAWVWHGDGAKFALRRTFDAPKVIRRAEMLLIADDEAEVIVNGDRVAVYRSANEAWGHRGGAAVIDLTPHLIPGQKNCVAARVEDKGLAKGFALDLRVNAPPLVPRLLVAKPEPAAKELLAEVATLAARLDDPEYKTREAATKALTALAAAHGQSVFDPLEDLTRNGSPEQQWRAGLALSGLTKERHAVFVPAGPDGRFFFPEVPLDVVKRWWFLSPEGNPVAYRHLVQAKVRRDADPKAFDAAVRELVATAGNDALTANLVGYVSGLELADLADVLTDVLERKPKTLAGALAASGLGRLGKDRLTDAQRKLLTKATECGHEPTVRAAKAALAAAGK